MHEPADRSLSNKMLSLAEHSDFQSNPLASKRFLVLNEALSKGEDWLNILIPRAALGQSR
jgi:hypothetical protein